MKGPPRGPTLFPDRPLSRSRQPAAPPPRPRQAGPAPRPQAGRLRVFALAPPREELYRRIDARAEAHFRAGLVEEVRELLARGAPEESSALDRKSTRLNSSHANISYAVFCLKKKKYKT